MDKTKYSNFIMVITYTFMAYCWAGKNLLPHGDMLITAFSGLILGVVTVYTEKLFSLPTYICRGIGAFFASLVIIEIYFFTGWAQNRPMTIIASMIPPVAAGAMLVEGLCTSHTQPGRKKIINAVLVSLFLALGVYRAILITRGRGLTI